MTRERGAEDEVCPSPPPVSTPRSAAADEATTDGMPAFAKRAQKARSARLTRPDQPGDRGTRALGEAYRSPRASIGIGAHGRREVGVDSVTVARGDELFGGALAKESPRARVQPGLGDARHSSGRRAPLGACRAAVPDPAHLDGNEPEALLAARTGAATVGGAAIDFGHGRKGRVAAPTGKVEQPVVASPRTRGMAIGTVAREGPMQDPSTPGRKR